MNDVKASSPRERILSVASRLFYEQGYYQTGVNQIIDEANVAKATFYSNFSTKQELGMAWLQACRAEFEETLEPILRSQLAPQEKIRLLFDRAREGFGEHYRGCPFLNVTTDIPDISDPMRQLAMQHKQVVLTSFTRLVERFAAGRVTPLKRSPEETAQTLYLLYESATIQSQVFGQSWPFDAARESALRTLE